jgi:hypothetical protein
LLTTFCSPKSTPPATSWKYLGAVPASRRSRGTPGNRWLAHIALTSSVAAAMNHAARARGRIPAKHSDGISQSSGALAMKNCALYATATRATPHPNTSHTRDPAAHARRTSVHAIASTAVPYMPVGPTVCSQW